MMRKRSILMKRKKDSKKFLEELINVCQVHVYVYEYVFILYSMI